MRDRVHAGAILAELADAVGSALVAAAEEQKLLAAERIAAVATALRRAAQSLDHSESPAIAGGTNRAADRIDALAHSVREWEWRDIVADAAGFARRRPALFGLAAVSLGFVAGRLLRPAVGNGAPGQPTPATEGAGQAASRADSPQPGRPVP
jgi:hypothetical protein